MPFCKPFHSLYTSTLPNFTQLAYVRWASGFSTAWLRAGSAIGPVMVGLVVGGYGIQYVFSVLAVVALIGGLVTFLFAIETKGQVLEKLSP